MKQGTAAKVTIVEDTQRQRATANITKTTKATSLAKITSQQARETIIRDV